MPRSQNVLIWIKLCVLILLTIDLQCTKQMEPSQIAGFDFQKYFSPTSYQSLYIQKYSTDFILISGRNRITGKLTSIEHSEVLELLNDENRDSLIGNSLLETDSLTYPYLIIRERTEQLSSTKSTFFIILDTRTSENIPSQIINLFDRLLVKYGG